MLLLKTLRPEFTPRMKCVVAASARGEENMLANTKGHDSVLANAKGQKHHARPCQRAG